MIVVRSDPTRDLAQWTSAMNAMTCPANIDARTAPSNAVTANRIAGIEVAADVRPVLAILRSKSGPDA